MNAVAGNDPPVPTDRLGDLLAVAMAAWPDLVFLAQQEQETAWRAALRTNAPALVHDLVVLTQAIAKHTILNPHAAIDEALKWVPALSRTAVALLPLVRPVYAQLAATASTPLPPVTLVDTTATHPDPDARKFVKQHEISPHFVAEAGGTGKRAFAWLTRLAAVREQAVQKRRAAEETMRKNVAHFGEGVKGSRVGADPRRWMCCETRRRF
ncbi:hypothetical protein AMAG_19079 [Allomyces macrogynus ATCC 38327]|uniref:Uncharacterized protein n=1 Tax=Allomyces macrogynus (strain ATCC 38327) TaxID=578462 RepID=A0A0L0SN81_ALLM3|nr:hypothetical protein AMAG_19079 [Allomyces macrogynus ATCC 38327]|eukprot:KNE63850.1 hypothetical protein AMAG_19079 [Allomyces macrogynus ATCC 38327]